MNIREAIDAIVTHGRALSEAEAADVMREIMSGEATPAQIGAFLVALRLKGETVDEITGMARVMREHALTVDAPETVVDTCGTGGDASGTFNVSTAAAFVVAAAGAPVAKHGNRAMTSACGSADVLEALGAKIDLPPEHVARCIREVGIGFMFAPVFHPAMKYAAAPRRAMGIRTVFNVLGPLSNPADADSHLLGVYAPELVTPIAQALRRLGCQEAMVVHGLDGLDELSTLGRTLLAWLRDDAVQTVEMTPRDFGLPQAHPAALQGATPQENAALAFHILTGRTGPADPKRDIVLLNAAAGIIVGGKADGFAEGLDLARESIDSGRAYTRLKRLVAASHGDPSRLERLESIDG